MKSKDLNVKFIHLKKAYGTEKRNTYVYENFKKGELKLIFDKIESLELKLNSPNTRYSKDDDPKCIIFPGEMDSFKIPKNSKYFAGAFFKRRTSDFPYEDNGDGMLQHLNLADKDAIAEITFFIIDKSNDLLIWLSNRNVSGYNGFAEYLTAMYISTCPKNSNDDDNSNLRFHPLLIDNKKARIDSFLIPNEDALNEFNNDMSVIKEMTLKIAGSMSELEKMINPSGDLNNLDNIVKVGKDIGGHLIEVRVVADKSSSLEKNAIKTLYKRIARSIGDNVKQMEIKGAIDDETRFIDLFSDKIYYNTQIKYDTKYIDPKIIFDELEKAHEYYLSKKD